MEIWKPVLSLSGLYEVSNLGGARAAPKIDSKGRARKLRPLKQSINKDGYKKIHTFIDGRAVHYFAHRLVYEAFHAAIPEGLTVNHKNGIRDDNRPENLEALSHHENILYSKNILKTNYATYGNLRMTDEVRSQIKGLAEQGMKHRDIAAIVGFSKSQVSNIVSGKSSGRPSATTPRSVGDVICAQEHGATALSK